MTLASLFGPAPCASCNRRGAWLCAPCTAAARLASESPLPAGVDRVVAAWAYEGGPRSLVLRLKLRHLSGAALPLIAAMVAAARSARLDADAITWVPARRRDISRRGFDHAEILARGVAADLGLPAIPLLHRAGSQADQTGLGREGRLHNLEGAFHAIGPVPARVLVIDDLVTTGATASVSATALKAAGAVQVTLLAACRA